MKKLMHAGNLILIGFGIMVLFIAGLVYECTQNPSVMVSDNYYEQELKFQDLIDARANAQRFNDSLLLIKNHGEVLFKIPKELNGLLQNLKIELYNTSDDKKDKNFVLQKNEEGIYKVNTSTWGSGSYLLKLHFTSGAKNYYKEFNYAS